MLVLGHVDDDNGVGSAPAIAVVCNIRCCFVVERIAGAGVEKVALDGEGFDGTTCICSLDLTTSIG